MIEGWELDSLKAQSLTGLVVNPRCDTLAGLLAAISIWDFCLWLGLPHNVVVKEFQNHHTGHLSELLKEFRSTDLRPVLSILPGWLSVGPWDQPLCHLTEKGTSHRLWAPIQPVRSEGPLHLLPQDGANLHVEKTMISSNCEFYCL